PVVLALLDDLLGAAILKRLRDSLARGRSDAYPQSKSHQTDQAHLPSPVQVNMESLGWIRRKSASRVGLLRSPRNPRQAFGCCGRTQVLGPRVPFFCQRDVGLNCTLGAHLREHNGII